MPKELPPSLDVNGNNITMKVSHQSTKEELEKWQKDLSMKNIEFNFSKSEFFDDGKIRKLSFTVLFPDGTQGSATGDLVAIQYRYFGFIYTPQEAVAFSIGDIFK